MKIKSIILPVTVAVVLLAAVAYWIYEYKSFMVEPRVAGRDNRPQAVQPEGEPET
jgi:hypothetical protein